MIRKYAGWDNWPAAHQCRSHSTHLSIHFTRIGSLIVWPAHGTRLFLVDLQLPSPAHSLRRPAEQACSIIHRIKGCIYGCWGSISKQLPHKLLVPSDPLSEPEVATVASASWASGATFTHSSPTLQASPTHANTNTFQLFHHLVLLSIFFERGARVLKAKSCLVFFRFLRKSGPQTTEEYEPKTELF
jgi:hypothetical protein